MSKVKDYKQIERPFVVRLGFEKLLNELEFGHCTDNMCSRDHYDSILNGIKNLDKIKEGFVEGEGWEEYRDDIQLLLSIVFPKPLSKNEIKVALVPFSSEVLFTSDRFKSIFGGADHVEVKEVMSFEVNVTYILMCKIIMGLYYNAPFETDVRSIYEVEDSAGILKYYKATYNADFINVSPINEPPILNEDDIQHLRENADDIKLWKSYFPPESWLVSGVGFKSFVDVSREQAVSRIKYFIVRNKHANRTVKSKDRLDSLLSTLLKVPRLRSTVIMYDSDNQRFESKEDEQESYALGTKESCPKEDLICEHGVDIIFNKKTDFIITDITALPEESKQIPLYKQLAKKGVKSYMVSPLYYRDELLGVIEITSKISKSLEPTKSILLNELKDLYIYAIMRTKDERENKLASIIQKEFTSIHPSVQWRFRDEASKALQAQDSGTNYNYSKISFGSLTALFGQSDIVGSSTARNVAITSDLRTQMMMVQDIITKLSSRIKMPLLDNIMYQIGMIKEKLASDLAAGMEQEVLEFLRVKINPLLVELQNRDPLMSAELEDYFKKIGNSMSVVYDKRKAYDDTVQLINVHLSRRLDKEQEKAQQIYPHFFERYKTDGVEHNMYIGQEIAPNIPYNKLYLDNLRLWQLQTMCQLEIEHRQRMVDYPMQLDIASLIMVYSNSLAIRYRMDEKQFDIDGAYNARYEIIKKRIDKAHIRGTNERITQSGKIVIIYTQPSDHEEYMNYISFLTYQGLIKGEPESFKIEELEGVIGLYGLRVLVNYDFKDHDKNLTQNLKIEKEQVESNA